MVGLKSIGFHHEVREGKDGWTMRTIREWGLMTLMTTALLAAASRGYAHCDTMAGPVAMEAMAALEKGEVEPVLKWVRPSDEAKVERAFHKALRGKKAGPAEKDPAVRRFLETLVRLHRESEGEPFTGLKPADTPLEPGVRESDEAIAKGSVDALAKTLAERIREKVREKHARVLRAKKHANESVEKGREYVAAYVDFVHTVEHLRSLSKGEGQEAHSHPGE
jgi:hypothetical protein